MDVFLLADSYFCLAESLLAVQTVKDKTEHLSRALAFLEIALDSSTPPKHNTKFADYSLVRHFERTLVCLGKMATLLNDMGDIQGRDSASRRFCTVKEQMSSK